MLAADMHRSLAETLENCRRLRCRLVEESELIRITGERRRERDKDNRSEKPPHAERYVSKFCVNLSSAYEYTRSSN